MYIGISVFLVWFMLDYHKYKYKICRKKKLCKNYMCKHAHDCCNSFFCKLEDNGNFWIPSWKAYIESVRNGESNRKDIYNE